MIVKDLKLDTKTVKLTLSTSNGRVTYWGLGDDKLAVFPTSKADFDGAKKIKESLISVGFAGTTPLGAGVEARVKQILKIR